MQQAARSNSMAAPGRPSRRTDCDDGPVLDDEAVLAHLEADFIPEAGGDPIVGVAVAVLAGAIVWLVLAVGISSFW